MNSRLLGRNRRQLMLILAILFMNVPVAEARLDWPEGTKGNIAIAGWLISSIAFGVGMAGTIVHAYRTIVGRRAILSDMELCNQIRESGEWLAYTGWIRAESPTTRPLERAAAARIIDLERQLFGVPSPPRRLLPRLSSCLFPSKLLARLFGAPKNGVSTTTPTSGDESINGNSRRNREKAPEHCRFPQPHILTADRTGFATSIIDVGKIVTHDSVSSARSAIPSKEFSTYMTKFASAKDGDDKATDRNKSMNETAEKARKSSKQQIITPPPKVQTAATSSNHDHTPAGSAAASRHNHVATPLLKLRLDPVPPSRKPLPFSIIPGHHCASSKRGLGLYEKEEKSAN